MPFGRAEGQRDHTPSPRTYVSRCQIVKQKTELRWIGSR
jgi:hypothetical protein